MEGGGGQQGPAESVGWLRGLNHAATGERNAESRRGDGGGRDPSVGAGCC